MLVFESYSSKNTTRFLLAHCRLLLVDAYFIANTAQFLKMARQVLLRGPSWSRRWLRFNDEGRDSPLLYTVRFRVLRDHETPSFYSRAFEKRVTMWIWQRDEWPAFQIEESALTGLLDEVARLADELRRQVGDGAASTQERYAVEQILDSLVSSYEIEREYLQRDSVRSSVVRALHPEQLIPPSGDRTADAVAQIYSGFLSHGSAELTEPEIFAWHTAVLDQDTARLRGYVLGGYRTEAMCVVSERGAVVHFEAPPASDVASEMRDFLDWMNEDFVEHGVNPWVGLAFAHLWFLTIHPFDDGNGRMARVLSDWWMMRFPAGAPAFVPLNKAILRRKTEYYDILEKTQRGSMDVTAWCGWFLERVRESLYEGASLWADIVRRTQRAEEFWRANASRSFLPEQKKVLERVFRGGPDDFPDGITRKQYQSVAKVSPATATRHLQELVAIGVFVVGGQGKATRYRLPADADEQGHLE